MAPTGPRATPTGVHFDRFFDIPVVVTCSAHDIDSDLELRTFKEMTLPKQLLQNVETEYAVPMPIQRRVIPHVCNSRDIMGWSPTGSGKTAAYTIPLIKFMIYSGDFTRTSKDPAAPIALVLLPTRELALQVTLEFEKLLNGITAKILAAFGGRGYRRQNKKLRSGCHILIATPGRLMSLITNQMVTLSKVKYFVLDEADTMLSMDLQGGRGFEKQVERIFRFGLMSPQHRTLMFSATFPRSVQQVAQKLLQSNYVHIKIDSVKTDDCRRDPKRATPDAPYVVNKDIQQDIKCVAVSAKLDKLQEILRNELAAEGTRNEGDQWTKKILIFVERKVYANDLAKQLRTFNFVAEAINANRPQKDRESALSMFVTSKIPILVATSVAARGLDICGVDLVINYEPPRGYDDWKVPHLSQDQRIAFYVQRIGRTGRAGHLGRSITFFDKSSEDREIGHHLIKVLEAAQQEVPPWLMNEFGEVGSRNFLDEE